MKFLVPFVAKGLFHVEDFHPPERMFDVVLTPKTGDGHEDGMALTYRKTLLLSDADGKPTTGLDPAWCMNM